ncbi:MAG TPA: hypothetical protein VE992_02750 [Solirubrobacteraceae bacterium]|nr:hypothetical protein [Solirubrobacteraceae bacterium]
MSATSPELSRARLDDATRVGVRRSTETKASFKTTEFIAYVAMLAGIFIAGAVTSATGYGGHHDVFRADRVWLYAMILTVGYMISRGLAKAGSREHYTEER